MFRGSMFTNSMRAIGQGLEEALPGRSCLWCVVFLAIFVSTFIASGCADEQPVALEGVSIVLSTGDDQGPASYLVIVAWGDSDFAQVMCGEEASPQQEPLSLRCTEEGVHLDALPDSLSVVVKARGYEVAEHLETLGLQSAGESSVRVELALESLPPAQRTDDYLTAIDTLEELESLAFESTTDVGRALVVKFTIHLGDSPEVYFQNTRRHLIHHDFVRTVLGFPMSGIDFVAASRGLDRQWIVGSVIAHPAVTVSPEGASDPFTAPLTLELFPSDDITPAQVIQAHHLLEARLGVAPFTGVEGRLVYLPAGTTQEDDLAAAIRLFVHHGVEWIRHADLYAGVTQQLLNAGVAYGTLRMMSPEELDSSVVSFRDILLLSRLPNELPLVGGTITEELQTPLAHVNVAARARGTPNMALLGASAEPEFEVLDGQLVRFEVSSTSYSLEPSTLEEAEAFWAQRVEREPLVPVFDVDTEGFIPFADLAFSDAVRVGAKAANLAELSHVLGERAPDGFAVPFAYYERFMNEGRVETVLCGDARADCVDEGRSASVCDTAAELCVLAAGASSSLMEYAAVIVDDAAVRADTELREAALDGLRYLIHHGRVDLVFAANLDVEVALRFGDEKVRLRSSTNAEDLEEFSGAGLYRSVSAYATDEPYSSGIVRKVWGSVWSWRAFEERAFWNMDHMAVKMGVAVHLAYPDEAANGVLITQNIADPNVVGMYVNVQLGDVPVTNPVGGALPEVFSIIPGPNGVQVARQRFSSMCPHASILSDEEIASLYTAAAQVMRHFAPLYGVDAAWLALDLEFKFLYPGRELVIK